LLFFEPVPARASRNKKTPPLSCVTAPLNRYNMRDDWMVFDDQ
jgi:hypothetical protein